jgi:exoribonuclease II
MPVTAKLLQRLQEALGEEATDDLFTWWEETARVNRAAVRDVADLYFARFDARLEKGMTELRAEFRTEMAAQRADLIKWMFIFWAGTVIPLAGLAIALSRL